MYAIDGEKLPSNASKEWSGTLKELTKKRDKLEQHMNKMIEQHKELDKNEKAKRIQKPFKKTMGDDTERREKSIERLEKKLEKINQFLKTAEPKMGAGTNEVKSNITDNESAFIKSSHGYIQGYNSIAVVDAGNQIIVSAEAIGSGAESGCFEKMLDKTEENLKMVTGKEKPLKNTLITGDTGYFSESNLQAAEKREIEVLIPDPQFRQRDPYYAEKKKEKVGEKKRYGIEDFKYDEEKDEYTCPSGTVLENKGEVTLRNNSGKKYQPKRGQCVICPNIEKCINRRTSKNPIRTLYVENMKYEENLSKKMKEKIDNPAYRELYSRRMQIVEPVFSNIAYCKGMNRYTLRGLEKVNIQWKLYCIVHNIWKCMNPLVKKYVK
jgi:hypothetical protein